MWMNRIHRWLLAVTAVGLLSAVAPRAEAARPDLAGMTSDEIAMLVFIGGGSPLSAAEKQQAGQIVAHAMATRPAFWTEADRRARVVLQRVASGDPIVRADLRERLRTAAALHPPGDRDLAQEAAIIAAHDPMVVFDAVHKLAITQQSLVAWQQADQLMAQRLHMPGPGPDFLTQAAATVRGSEAHWDAKTRDAYAHIGRNLAAMQVYLSRDANPQKIDAYFARLHTELTAQGPATTQPQRLATYTAVALLPAAYTVHAQRMARAGGAAGMAGAMQLQLDAMKLRQIHHTIMCAPGDSAGLCGTLP